MRREFFVNNQQRKLLENLVIRDVTMADLKANLTFRHIASSETDFLNDLSEDEEIKNIKNAAEGDPVYWVIKDDSKTIGVCFIYAIPKKKEFRIGLIAIMKEYWGLGIASKVFDMVKQLAKEKSYKSITLYVDDKNVRAKQLYKKVGFEVTETVTYHDMEMKL